jgi:type IV secretion system protein VirB5
MFFRRSIQRYGRTPQPETRYQKDEQLWDERIGSARVQAANWRYMAFGCFGLSVALAGANIWQSSQSRVTPYVVEVDKLGEPRVVSPAIQNYHPSDGEIAWQLKHFIEDVRRVSPDGVQDRNNWDEAYGFVTDRGKQFLNDYARATDPLSHIADHNVSVQVTSVVRVTGTSFQVKWTEQTFDHGSLATTAHWTAILSIVTDPPKRKDILNANPLGIYVNAIDWTRELDPPAVAGGAYTAPPPPQPAKFPENPDDRSVP